MTAQTTQSIEYTCDGLCGKKVIIKNRNNQSFPKGWKWSLDYQHFCPSCFISWGSRKMPEHLIKDSQLIEFPLHDEVLADFLEELGYLEQSEKLRP